MSDLSASRMVAHLSWATWAICSQSLICLERPERFPHSPSFVLNDLSELLTVDHLIWAKWANKQIPSPGFFYSIWPVYSRNTMVSEETLRLHPNVYHTGIFGPARVNRLTNCVVKQCGSLIGTVSRNSWSKIMFLKLTLLAVWFTSYIRVISI